MKILAIGDVVGSGGVEYLQRRLRAFKRANGIDLTVVNGENSAKSNGIDPTSANALIDAGADIITTGNHVFKTDKIYDLLDESDCVIRPANLPDACPGRGYTVLDLGHTRVLVMNVLGVVTLEPLACPFETVERILEKERGNYDISILDIHAEATSEKLAMGYHLDGRVQIVFGTHTHVPTADTRVLPKGTGYVTDLGMTGPQNGILGTDAEAVLYKMRTHMPTRFTVADGEIRAQAVLFTLEDQAPYRCVKVERVTF